MGTFYTPPTVVIDGDTAFAKDVNEINQETDTAFTLLEAFLVSLEFSVEQWAILAEAWAQNPEDDEVVPGEFSSLHWSIKSNDSATASATSESNAATSESNAATSESNAAQSVIDATAQVGLATVQADAAATSAGEASTSADEAAASAVEAADVAAGNVFDDTQVLANKGFTSDKIDADYQPIAQSSYDQIADASLGTGTHTFDYANGDMQQLTVTGDITIAFSNFVVGKVSTMILDLVNGGDWTITYPVGTLFSNLEEPVLTSGGTDRILIIKDKDEVYSFLVVGTNIGVVA